jgi:hypothetical protein
VENIWEQSSINDKTKQRATLTEQRSVAIHNLKYENINFLAPNTEFAAQNPDIRPFSPISCRKLGIYRRNVAFFVLVGTVTQFSHVADIPHKAK